MYKNVRKLHLTNNHPTIKNLQLLCEEYISSELLKAQLCFYLKSFKCDKKWLDAMLPLVQCDFFLGYMSKSYMQKLGQQCTMHYMLFLSENAPGKVVMWHGPQHKIYAFDPRKPIPENIYTIMTTEKPLFRRDVECHVSQPAYHGCGVLYVYCTECGRSMMDSTWYQSQKQHNSIVQVGDTNVYSWIPCNQCKDGIIIV